MDNYVIHACPERMWYVNEYLVPSLQEQKIKDIDVRCDNNHLGCLESCMQIFGSMPNDNDGAWHLQDDVAICRNFKTLTEQYNSGVVCGFTKSASTKIGFVKPEHMWWSFPCIRIPNKIARECSEWFYSFAKGYAKYYEWVQLGKCDDNFFKEFLITKYPNKDVLNLRPNLVDHIDWMIGGSIVNKYRGNVRVQAQYFNDKDLVIRLCENIKKRMKNNE